MTLIWFLILIDKRYECSYGKLEITCPLNKFTSI